MKTHQQPSYPESVSSHAPYDDMIDLAFQKFNWAEYVGNGWLLSRWYLTSTTLLSSLRLFLYWDSWCFSQLKKEVLE